MVTEAQLQEIVRRIVEGYQPDRIILFGSYAYGTPTADSDVDLLVVKADDAGNRAARATQVYRLLRDPALPAVDILVYTPAELARATAWYQAFESRAVRDGRQLYAA